MIQPLALSDNQFALVLDGANKVLPNYRSRYLEAVTHQLRARGPVTTDDVESAVAATLTRMVVAK